MQNYERIIYHSTRSKQSRWEWQTKEISESFNQTLFLYTHKIHEGKEAAIIFFGFFFIITHISSFYPSIRLKFNERL